MPTPTQDERQTQSAQAADEILRRIATLDLAPGTTFTERELADRLGIGRVPVREGLLRLASSGLLSPRTGSGYTVAPVTLHTARDAFEAWKVIEPAALELAMARGRAPSIATALREAADPSLDGVSSEFQFHLGLLIASANQHLVRADTLVEVWRLLLLAVELGEPHPGCTAEEHAQLLSALEAEDPRAVDLARETIAGVQRRVLLALSSADSLQGVNVHRPS